MAAKVLELALQQLPKQVDWTAPRVACAIPFGRLVAVCADVQWGETEIYGLVQRKQVLEEENLTPDGFKINLWVLRLVQDLDGSHHWEDFIPVCKNCKEMMRPIMSREEQPACPACKGRKGKGKCFQFDCPEYSEASNGCGKVKPAYRPVYCGSHPYLGGYRVADEYFGNSGHPLFQYEEDSCESTNNFSIVGDRVCEGIQIDIFCGGETSKRIHIDLSKQSIMSPVDVRKCEGADLVSSATLLGCYREYVEGKCVHYMYLLVHRHGHPPCVLRSAESKPNQWLDWAPLNFNEECCDFQKQVVVVPDTRCKAPHRLAALSHDSLWVMDVPDPDINGGPKTARDMASKISWRRVLKFTDAKKVDESDDTSDDQDYVTFPSRLLAPGPKPNQVVIFAADETKKDVVRPRLLVEIPESQSDVVLEAKAIHLTSVVNVPLKSRDVGERSLSSEILPSIIRITGKSGGYLLASKLGQVYHVPDEAIIMASIAWKAPDFRQGSGKHHFIAFKFHDAEHRVDVRLCSVSALERYEYFQKLLGQWEEGLSAEVTITDVDSDVFGHFLTYIHNGTVDSQLELDALAKLIVLANKYLMHDLVASCLVGILSILQNPERMKQQDASALADMLAFSDNASMCCPTLMRKLIGAVLSYRGDVIKDQEFLKRLSHASAKALSSLMAPLAPRKFTTDRFGMRKRRKAVLNTESTLWHYSRDESESPKWCCLA